MTSATNGSRTRSYNNMVTQMYTFNSWAKQKPMGGLPYVGFPGLTLTPIPESPLLMDSILNEDQEKDEREKWLCDRETTEDSWNPKAMKNGAFPEHWLSNAGEPPSPDPIGKHAGMLTHASRPKTCAVNVHVVQSTTFLPKDQPMTTEQRRAYICKLLLFALCGFVIVAGIVLWIFSPAFI